MAEPDRALDAVASIGELDVRRTPRAAFLRGQALAALGSWTAATAALDAARTGARAQGARPLLWRIDAVQGQVYRANVVDSTRARHSTRHGRAPPSSSRHSRPEHGLGIPYRRRPHGATPAAAHGASGGEGRIRRTHPARTRHRRARRTRRVQSRHRARLGIGERTVEAHVATPCPSSASPRGRSWRSGRPSRIWSAPPTSRRSRRSRRSRLAAKRRAFRAPIRRLRVRIRSPRTRTLISRTRVLTLRTRILFLRSRHGVASAGPR